MTSIIINYSSNEKIFIEITLQECKKFSDDIVVSYGSHLYNGRPEDLNHIHILQKKFPDVKFVKYKVDLSLDLYKQKGVINRPTAYWHNLARWSGVLSLKNTNNWVFIIDVDEVPDGDLVKKWLNTINHFLNINECYKIANYWYFKDPTNQAKTIEDSVLLIHKKHLTENNIFNDLERDSLIKSSNCKLNRMMVDENHNVMWNHFSFVRGKNQLTHKLKYWAHNNEYDADSLIEYIFRNDDVNDIIHGYQYNKVENKWNIKI